MVITIKCSVNQLSGDLCHTPFSLEMYVTLIHEVITDFMLHAHHCALSGNLSQMGRGFSPQKCLVNRRYT